jgi:hypothetical protein
MSSPSERGSSINKGSQVGNNYGQINNNFSLPLASKIRFTYSCFPNIEPAREIQLTFPLLDELTDVLQALKQQLEHQTDGKDNCKLRSSDINFKLAHEFQQKRNRKENHNKLAEIKTKIQPLGRQLRITYPTFSMKET